jgi:hypothetical protein
MKINPSGQPSKEKIFYPLIAATVIHHGLPLVTTNPKHFPMPDLTVYQTDDAGKMTRWTR